MLSSHACFASCSWDFSPSGGFPGLGNLYLALMSALDTINPGLLYFLEGVGQLSLSQSGGAGFATDPATVSAFNISSAADFFQQLLLQPYIDQVGLAACWLQLQVMLAHAPACSRSKSLGVGLVDQLHMPSASAQ